MIHLRLVVPPELVPAVPAALLRAPEVTNVRHLPGSAAKPPGDLVLCDAAKEERSSVLRELCDLGLEQRGSIAVEAVDAALSSAARAAERAAPGSPAVVWEEVEGRLSESGTLSVPFLLLITTAALIGAIAISTDSIVLIIGAMVVGPEFGPLAGVCVALVQRRPRLALRSLAALGVGFPLAILAAAMLTQALRATGLAPVALGPSGRELTLFISHPTWYSLVVAVPAGVVGMLALLGAKSGPLTGVFISLTTIPAASNAGVAGAHGNWDEAGGAAAQLAINPAAIPLSGLPVLWVTHRAGQRRRARRLRPAPE